MLLTKTRLKKFFNTAALGLLLAASPASIATAVCDPDAQTCSTNYQVTESFFGSGGTLEDSCSTTYCAKQSAGALGVGNTSSTNFQAQAGFNTNRQEFLEFIVNTTSVDVGVLDPTETHVGTATFQVKTYLAEGYQVTSSGTAPSTGGHTLSALASPTASSVGTEQFGINVVENTCPGTAPGAGDGSCSGTLGADPAQIPDATFSFGATATGYDTADAYKYVDGDTIAESTKSSGTTLYTISYLFNISNTTPAGTYRMDHILVATSTF